MKEHNVEHDDLGVKPKEKIKPKRADVKFANLDDQEVLV